MPTIEFELSIQEEFGTLLIAGIDEAGRGAIAGPVVAAAVILPLDQPGKLELLDAVNDSKQVSPKQREELFEIITSTAIATGVAAVPAPQIDELGIIPANAMAMTRAVNMLNPIPEFLLIDGRMRLRKLLIHQKSIIRGDGLSLSIAAASILAKVTRDRHMVEMNAIYPDYNFSSHKGYGTPAHQAEVEKVGPSPIHRYSFAPIRQTLLD
jgi:ribonuclease HII